MTHSRLTGLKDSLIISSVFFAAFMALVISFSAYVDWPAEFSIPRKAVYLNRFFSDYSLWMAVILLFWSRNKWLRLISYAVLGVFTAVYYTQISSYQFTGAFMPAVALENAQHVDFLDTNRLAIIAISWLLVICLALFLSHRLIKSAPPLSSRLIIVMVLLLAAIGIKNDKSFLPDMIVQQRADFFDSGRPGVRHVSPLSEFKDTLTDYAIYVARQNWVSDQAKEMTPMAASFAYDFGHKVGELSSEFPLLRKAPEHSPLPFLPQLDQDAAKKNIIIFFAEGISARLIQPYGTRFPNISPNILDFSERVIRVDNYFSHAYATYRALGAQLCSIYPVGRLLNETSYYCLGQALQKVGYNTEFLVSQSLENTDLDRVMGIAGFEKLWGSKQLGPLISLPADETPATISDRQFIRSFIARLKQLEGDKSKPFTVGLYNFETHTGIKVDEAKPYLREGRERSYVLDTFHNFDEVFGEFWRYFKNSSHYDDTIVVFTTDHATYPARDYVKEITGDRHFAPVFVDEIPLLIYHPDLEESVTIDARYASSVNLVPSLLHLLGYQQDVVPFVGQSIFATGNKYPPPSASGGTVLWSRMKSGRWARISKSSRDSYLERTPDGVGLYDFIKYTQGLESTNRLWESTENE